MKTWASVDSAKEVAMPSRATTHIQNRAPGPPSVTASATPAMLPVPTRPPSPMTKAWKLDRLPRWWRERATR